MRYRAFISYSHADEGWARWLMRRLETYRVPSRLVGEAGRDGPIPARLGAFFRDREELTAAGDLGSSIRDALAEAGALLVICSPAAAQSRWVDAEVEAFRASGRGDRVLCFVVAGDPKGSPAAGGCFPPALLAAGADGRATEPLAADARPEGDGRERAFLKLVAGLLGVGYDTLARREAQRRQRRLAVIATASLAGMTVALALAATAWVARNDAQRRQVQAEDILGFMLGDLRAKLGTVGRLDLMRAVDDKAAGYFATLDPRDLSDRALEEQARSLTGIGQVRLDEGDHDAAMSAFREAHARSTALQARAPGDGQRLFDLAQAEYWIGFVAWQQGRLDDAEAWLRRYRDSAIRLAAMERGNFGWQQEVAYGHYNLAVLDEGRGRHAQAEQAMREALALRKDWSRQRPGDADLRGSLANTLSWLGSLAATQGRLAEAEALFGAEVEAVSRNVAQEPLRAEWQHERAEALLLLAQVQARRGRLVEARASVDAAQALAATLARHDPANNLWQSTAASCRWWQAQLASAARDSATADALASEAEAVFARTHLAEPKNERLLGWLAKARNLQAQLALDRGDATAARARLSASLALIEPARRGDPDESLRQLLTDHWLLAGEAERLLLAEGAAVVPFERLDPLVRVLHLQGRSVEARPHRQRLASAGYVPLRPWPAAPALAQR